MTEDQIARFCDDLEQALREAVRLGKPVSVQTYPQVRRVTERGRSIEVPGYGLEGCTYKVGWGSAVLGLPVIRLPELTPEEKAKANEAARGLFEGSAPEERERIRKYLERAKEGHPLEAITVPRELQYTRPSLEPLGAQVNQLDVRCRELKEFCGYLLATLQLPANRENLHPTLIDMVDRWTDRFSEITKDTTQP